LLSGVFLPAATADTEDAVSLLSAGSSGVTFVVRVPWEQLSLEPVTANGKQYVRVSLPGWSPTAQAGAPVLPLVTKTIGVPFGAVLSVQVEPGPAHTMALPAPALPVAAQKVEWKPPAGLDGIPAMPVPSYVVEEDVAVYGGDAAYPGALAEVSNDGVMRQQRVVGIATYPVQYNAPTRELTIYESLQVAVTFSGAPVSLQRVPAAESVVYEELLKQELLNYDTARAWRSSVLPSSEEAGMEAEPWAPPVPGWRVKVREEGFYKLTYAELLAAGVLAGNPDPRTFRLYNLGSEVAIFISGEGDGVFNDTDFLLFYGQPVSSKYTRDNVYWLTCGQGTGLRMGSRSGTPGSAATPAYYPARRHLESNVGYIPFTPGDDTLERWVWANVYPPSKPSWSYTFSLAAPYAGTYPAELTVALLGYLLNAINPDHHARVYLNNTLLSDVTWDGITWQMVEVPIAQSLLLAGDNTLKVECPNDTGVGMDLMYVDWAELEFANTFRAEANALAFSYAVVGTWKYQVDGFSSNQLAVYDVTNPAAVVRISGVAVAGSGPYSAVFQDAVAAAKVYFALADTAYKAVQAVESDTPSSLRSTANGADYIVITHAAFAAQADLLRGFRESQGLPAKVVDVQDVYDEFGYGIEGAAAIHDFLAYAYGHWVAPAPSTVVLLGDGHYDPKNYADYGRVSYLPPYLARVDPWMGETAGDNRYVTLVGADTLPDMMLGRLAVNSSAEASAFVDKIIAYEQSPVSGVWRQKVLAVADNADGAGDFAQMSDDLLSTYLPESYQAEKVYYGVTHPTVAGARAAIQAGINAGKLIVNYIGHAAADQWADESLFAIEDVPLLQNGAKLPVVLALTCNDGYYVYPHLSAAGRDAVAEVVTRAEGRGAVASWSPTGQGNTPGHQVLNEGFFEAVFQVGLRTLGEATNAGKLKLWATGGNLELLDTYLLFGDPALRLPVSLFGDMDGDCDVDVVDIMLVASRWGSSVGDPEYDARYDLDGNGTIDTADVMLVAARWDTHC
jgi:hypothetical protein